VAPPVAMDCAPGRVAALIREISARWFVYHSPVTCVRYGRVRVAFSNLADFFFLLDVVIVSGYW
jgi:hypothetical protein